MKKLLFITTCILLVSCSDKSKIKDEINNYVEKNFNDPDSYQFIDLQIIDTLTEQKVSNYLKTERLEKIERIKKIVDEKTEEHARRATRALFGGNRFYLMNTVNELEKEKKIIESFSKDSIKNIQNEIKILDKFKKSKKVSHFKYIHEYRAKNDVGALVKCIDTIRITNDLKLIEDIQKYLIKRFGVGTNQ